MQKCRAYGTRHYPECLEITQRVPHNTMVSKYFINTFLIDIQQFTPPELTFNNKYKLKEYLFYIFAFRIA